MTTEILKQYETEVEKLVNRMSDGHKLVLAKYLYNDGIRQQDIDKKLLKIKEHIALRTEETSVENIGFGFMGA